MSSNLVIPSLAINEHAPPLSTPPTPHPKTKATNIAFYIVLTTLAGTGVWLCYDRTPLHVPEIRAMAVMNLSAWPDKLSMGRVGYVKSESAVVDSNIAGGQNMLEDCVRGVELDAEVNFSSVEGRSTMWGKYTGIAWLF